MKKSLLFAAAALSAVAANAETFTYDFNTNPPYCAVIASEDGPTGGANYDFIDQYGQTTNVEGFNIVVQPEGEKAHATLGLGISLVDGALYRLSEDIVLEEDLPVITPELYNQPFISWGEKGVTRTLLMPGWGSEDEWKDVDYNGATADDWVATKNAISFLRLGHLDLVSRSDTYIQFPAVTGNVSVSIWAGAAPGKASSDKNPNLKVKVTPVVDGVADEENAIIIEKEAGTFPLKRMIKLDPIQYDATGKNVAFQIGCDGFELQLYHVVIEGEPAGDAGLDNIIVDNAADVNAPVYNVLGQRVNDSYKGLVIKGGKKYIQK